MDVVQIIPCEPGLKAIFLDDYDKENKRIFKIGPPIIAWIIKCSLDRDMDIRYSVVDPVMLYNNDMVECYHGHIDSSGRCFDFDGNEYCSLIEFESYKNE